MRSALQSRQQEKDLGEESERCRYRLNTSRFVFIRLIRTAYVVKSGSHLPTPADLSAELHPINQDGPRLAVQADSAS